ncbi:MAG: DUF2569 family protein [Pseudomonadota bacterium]
MNLVNDIHAFGGWLRLFQILNIIFILSFTLYPVAFTLLIFVPDTTTQEYIELTAGMLGSLPIFIFSVLILRELPVQYETTPEQIATYLKYLLALSLLTSAMLFLAYHMEYITERPAAILIDLIYYAIWVSYFRRSKRVKAHYGANSSMPKSGFRII